MDAFCCRHDVPGDVFCVCVCVCVSVCKYSFAGFTGQTQPPTFSETAIADTTILLLRAHWVHLEKYHDELMFLKTKRLSISPFD